MSKPPTPPVTVVPPRDHELTDTEFVPSAPLLGPEGRPWGICGVGADATVDDDEIPGRFMRGLQFVEKDARERWQKTKTWRADEGIDYLLDEPHPGFFQFKKNYPHYYHKQSKTGEYLYIERCGQGKVDNLWKMGFDIKQLARHYCFTSEFMWRMVDRDDDKMIISIFDLKGCSMAQLKGSQLQLFRECSGLVGDHYPERSRMTFVINAPWWISAGFAIVKPFMDPRTFEKIKVLGGDYKKTLLEYFDAENLPQELGGTDTDGLGESPVEKQMLAHIQKINRRWTNLPSSLDDEIENDGFRALVRPFEIPQQWKDCRNDPNTPNLRDTASTTQAAEEQLAKESGRASAESLHSQSKSEQLAKESGRASAESLNEAKKADVDGGAATAKTSLPSSSSLKEDQTVDGVGEAH